MKKTTFTPKPASRQTLDDFVGVTKAATTNETTGEKLKRFTFDVTPSLHRRVKTGCAARGIEMADLMREFLEKEFPNV